MPNPPHVLDAYASRLRTDLEENENEQQRLRSALHQLEREHEVLTQLQATLDTGTEAVSLLLQENSSNNDTKADDDGLEAPREPHEVADESHVRLGRPRNGRHGERPLIDIVGDLLREQGQPRSAAEMHHAVTEVRPTTEQTVRNTLDRLVASSKAERTKQGRSVFYQATEKLLQTRKSPVSEEVGQPA